MAKEDSVPVRINPGLCRFLGVEAKLFGCRKHPFVIGDELAKIGPELSGALEVDRTSNGNSTPAALRMRSLTRIMSTRLRTVRPRARAASPSRSSARRTSVRARALEIKGVRRRRCRRSAIDSGSSTTSLTIADESRYVAAVSVRCPGNEQGPPREARVLLMAAGRGGPRGPKWRRRSRRRGGAVAEGSQPAAA